MVRQARIGNTVLVKSREITGSSKTMPWWLGGKKGKGDMKQSTLALLLRINLVIPVQALPFNHLYRILLYSMLLL